MKGIAGKILTAVALVAIYGSALAQQGTALGVVRKVDADAGRVIVRHGDFEGIQMTAMTMVFKVREKAILTGVNVQDVVRITVVQEGRDFVITRIERVASERVSLE